MMKVEYVLNVPVMVCGFKRPDTLEKVIASLRVVRPSRLYLVLDAPRDSNQNNNQAVAKGKEIFESRINW